MPRPLYSTTITVVRRQHHYLQQQHSRPLRPVRAALQGMSIRRLNSVLKDAKSLSKLEQVEQQGGDMFDLSTSAQPLPAVDTWRAERLLSQPASTHCCSGCGGACSHSWTNVVSKP